MSSEVKTREGLDPVRILCVGHICLDLISECEFFPSEDNKIGTHTHGNRCISQSWQRGGNAANNSTVLAILGEYPAILGTIADSEQKSFLLSDFNNYNIDVSNLLVIPGTECPSSNVILSQATGSRTIIHSNSNLPEVSFDQFKKLDLTKYSWIHFEGRNIENVIKMIRHIEGHCSNSSDKITVSLEMEKNRPGIHELLPLGDVVFVSKDYAAAQGCANMDETLDYIAPLLKSTATVICPWGDKGACGQDSSGNRVYSQAFPPIKVVDTLGAGDTFMASAILGLSSEWSLLDSITFGCKIAGIKIGVKGWREFKLKIQEKETGEQMREYFCRRRSKSS